MDTSVPAVIPVLRYRDAPAAIRWLVGTFGLRESFVAPGDAGTVAHAQLTWAGGMVMLASRTDDPLGADQGPAWIYVIVDDIEEHHDRAVDAGAEIVQPLVDEDYGGSGYTARDPEGNLWSFGTYRPELA
jgi:uncharacterized glyoxalase superfamily protein PhnB